MKFRLFISLVISFCFTSNASAQSLAVNSDGSTANASALLDVKSTTKGILVPRMSRTERNAIASPATGLMIFQSGPDSVGFHYFDGTRWTWILSNANADSTAWRTGGNSGTNPANHFLGTSDNVPLVIKTNNAEKLRLTTNGEFGFGTATPNSSYGYAKMEIASEGFLAPTDLLIRNAVNSAGYAPGLVFQHARGTLAAPVSVNNGDYLSAISTMNYDGTNYILSAGLDIYADGAIAANTVPTRLMFNTMNTTGNYATRLTIKNDGKTGIGTTAPNSTLQVDGTISVGVSMGIAGNAIGTPTVISTQKAYLGLSPAGANIYYELPDPTTCTGRIYYIRNNDNTNSAWFRAPGATLLCPGSGTCLAAGTYYELKATVSVKSVMVISDGINWSVFQMD